MTYAPTFNQIISFIGFLILSYALLRVIFNFSTYHAYAAIALPVLAVFAAISGWAFFRLQLHGFFFWYLLLVGCAFYSWHRKNYVSPENLVATSKAMADSGGVDEGLIIRSYLLTRRYFLLSIVCYSVVFSISYLFFYNQNA